MVAFINNINDPYFLFSDVPILKLKIVIIILLTDQPEVPGQQKNKLPLPKSITYTDCLNVNLIFREKMVLLSNI